MIFFSTLAKSSEATSEKKEPSISEEELIAKSVAAIDQLIDNAPTVPERPVLVEEVPEEAAEEVQEEIPEAVQEEVVESSQSIPEKKKIIQFQLEFQFLIVHSILFQKKKQ